jgi:hypothetical protein
VLELGRFEGGSEHPEHWKAILEYILRKEKVHYLRTETITQPGYTEAVEKVLPDVGFKLVTTLASSHGKREGKKYNINVWEWIKK